MKEYGAFLSAKSEDFKYFQEGPFNNPTVEKGEDAQALLNSMRDLLESCYWWGVNPLPRLREIFPDFEWKYWELPDTMHQDEKNKQLVRIKDAYVWWRIGEGWSEVQLYVTADRK